jgi:crotonobetainyl-CoA:carnitine CoA-transferase CaiB-like acyl-CoA transferase
MLLHEHERGGRYMILEGIRVLDMTKLIAGPYAGMILGDLGAEVIKIETPGIGDDGRNTYPKKDEEISAFFAAYNISKKSVTLNLKKPEALQAFKKLAATADVLLENMRTGVAEKLGVGYEDLKKINPGMIYCSVSGYGRTGPYRYKGGYDIIAQAQFGMMAVTGNGRDDEPVRTAYSVNDVGTGICAAFGVVIALMHRTKTGEGQRVGATLMNTQMALASHMASMYDITHTDHTCHGMASFQLAPHQGYRAKDAWVIIATSNEAQWDEICASIPEFAALHEDPLYHTMQLRVVNRHSLAAIFEKKFKDMTAAQVQALFDGIGIPCTKVNNMSDIYADEFFMEATMDRVSFPGHGTIPIVKLPMTFDTITPVKRKASPGLGEHNSEVFSALGYTEDEIARICR